MAGSKARNGNAKKQEASNEGEDAQFNFFAPPNYQFLQRLRSNNFASGDTHIMKRLLMLQDIHPDVFESVLGLESSSQEYLLRNIEGITLLSLVCIQSNLEVAKMKVFHLQATRIIELLLGRDIEFSSNDLDRLYKGFTHFFATCFTTQFNANPMSASECANQESQEQEEAIKKAILVSLLTHYVRLVDYIILNQSDSKKDSKSILSNSFDTVSMLLDTHFNSGLKKDTSGLVDLLHSIGNLPSATDESLVYLLYKKMMQSPPPVYGIEVYLKYVIVTKRAYLLFQSMNDFDSVMKAKSLASHPSLRQLVDYIQASPEEAPLRSILRSAMNENGGKISLYILASNLFDENVISEQVLEEELLRGESEEEDEEENSEGVDVKEVDAPMEDVKEESQNKDDESVDAQVQSSHDHSSGKENSIEVKSNGTHMETVNQEDEDEEEKLELKPKRRGRPPKKKEDDEDNKEESEEEKPKKRGRPSKKENSEAHDVIVIEDDVTPAPKTPTPVTPAAKGRQTPATSTRKSAVKKTEISPVSSSHEDGGVTPRRSTRVRSKIN